MDSLKYGNIIKVDLDKPLVRLNVGEIMASGDALANRYGAQLHRSGVDVDASACSVIGYLIRPNDETLKLDGVASGNMVYVDIPDHGYAYDGAFTLTIKVNGDGMKKAIVIFDGKIARTTTETIVDGDRVLYDTDAILALIDDMEKAEADALSAAEKANTASSKAPYIGSNGNWFVWDAASESYKDSGTKATGDDGEDGQDGADGITPNITFTAATGEPGTDVQISQSGTAANPVVNLTIPRGIPGEGSVSTVDNVQPDASGNVALGAVRSINGSKPDSSGNIELDAGGGTVQSVNNIAPDEETGNITLTAEDVGARPSTWTPSAADVGALAADGTAADSSRFGGLLPEAYAKAGETGGMTMELLWENASLSSDFAAQTVDVDLSGYKKILVVFEYGTSKKEVVVSFPDGNGYCVNGNSGWNQSGYYLTFNRRNFTVNANGIVFADNASMTQSSYKTDNSAMKPYRIYGIA